MELITIILRRSTMDTIEKIEQNHASFNSGITPKYLQQCGVSNLEDLDLMDSYQLAEQQLDYNLSLNDLSCGEFNTRFVAILKEENDERIIR